MFSGSGVEVDAWVTVDDDCRLACEVLGDHAQFTFGRNGEALMLVIAEEALARFVPMASEALERWRAIPVGAEVGFEVAAPAYGVSAGQEHDQRN